MAAEQEEIVTQPPSVSEAQAIERVESRPTARLKRLVLNREAVRAERRYKPYYAFDVVLTKRVFRDEDRVLEGSIVIDGLSGIARPFTTEAIETERAAVPPSAVLEPDVAEDDALVEARSRRMQVEHRERAELEMDPDPGLVYKPVWLVELADESVRAVDATDGRVYGDLLLG